MKFFNSKDVNGRTIIFSRDEISKIEFDEGKLNIGVNVYLKGSDAPLYVKFPDSKDLVEPTSGVSAFKAYAIWEKDGYIIDLRQIASLTPGDSENIFVHLRGGSVIELKGALATSLKSRYSTDYFRYID